MLEPCLLQPCFHVAGIHLEAADPGEPCAPTLAYETQAATYIYIYIYIHTYMNMIYDYYYKTVTIVIVIIVSVMLTMVNSGTIRE